MVDTIVHLCLFFFFMFCSFMPVFSSIRKRRKRLKCNENISNMFACGSRAFFSLEGRVGGLNHGLM